MIWSYLLGAAFGWLLFAAFFGAYVWIGDRRYARRAEGWVDRLDV